MNEKNKKTIPSKTSSVAPDFVFGKKNYILMLIGLAFIIAGFVLMSGGGSEDPNKFSGEIFSVRRITLAPIVVIMGFIIEIYAILKKTKE